jgi:CO dehydrogenase maturation factor
MKIAAVGKGGSGKTTIAGTLARIFARDGRKILAIDGDPNPNLALILGMSRAAADRLIYIPSNVMRRVDHADGSHRLEPSEPRPDIMRKYAAHAADNVDLIVMGKPAHGTAGSGCMCASHRAVRGLIAELTGFGEHTITDMEAGLEHLKRGTARHVDMMLIVAEPYYRSLEAASRTAELAAELKIPYIKVVANKVRSADDRQAIEIYCRHHKMDIIGVVPYDDALIEAERGGQAPIDFAPSSKAITAIREIATQITEHVPAATTQPGGIGSVRGTQPGC